MVEVVALLLLHREELFVGDFVPLNEFTDLLLQTWMVEKMYQPLKTRVKLLPVTKY